MTISMREQMAVTIEDLFGQDQRLALLLASISTDLFKKLLQDYPERALNLGILEQTLISVAAGMALEGYIPIAHSIVPFLVERPFAQLKDDFCYQQLGGNFISIGASYDYSTEGMTHHGPSLAPVFAATIDMDVTLLYCTTIAPFDAETLRATTRSNNIVLVEPYYEGVLVADIASALQHVPVHIEAIGVPHQVLTHYGTPQQHDHALGLTPQGIQQRVERFLSLKHNY